MNAQEIINYIATAPKKTPVKMYVNLTEPVDFTGCGAKVFGEGLSLVVFGNWADLEPSSSKTTAATPACRFSTSRTSAPASNRAP